MRRRDLQRHSSQEVRGSNFQMLVLSKCRGPLADGVPTEVGPSCVSQNTREAKQEVETDTLHTGWHTH